MCDAERDRLIEVLHRIPRRYVQSPSEEFHNYVASRPTKHAYRSAEVEEVGARKPVLRDQGSLLVGSAVLWLLLLMTVFFRSFY